MSDGVFLKTNRPAVDQLIRIMVVIGLLWWTYLLVKPFLGFLAWGFILAVALYPAYNRLNRRLGGSHSILASSILIISGIVIVIGTMSLITRNMVNTLTVFIQHVHTGQPLLPKLPESVMQWPLIGQYVHDTWEAATSNLGALMMQYADFLVKSSKVVLLSIADKTVALFVFIFSMLFSGYLLVHADRIVDTIHSVMERITPGYGDSLMRLMKETIRNVSVGVIGIALLQSILFGLLLVFMGFPAVGILSILALLMSIAQVGLILLVIPVMIWLFMFTGFTTACIYSVLLVLTALIDGFIKPFVLAHGLRTPMIVIFFGVIGGLLEHGLVGVFIGPVILAIFYDVMQFWLRKPLQ